MKAPLAILGIFSATAASAACPTVADLDNGGIWIGVNDGGTLHMTRGSGDIIVETSYYPDEDPLVTEMIHGIYFLQDGTMTNGSIDPDKVTRYTYPDRDKLPDPDKMGTWSSPIKIKWPDDDQPTNDRVTFSSGAPVPLTIGDCSYTGRMIFGRIEYEDGSSWITQYQYITDLGLSMFVAAGETAFSYEFTYSATSISTERP